MPFATLAAAGFEVRGGLRSAKQRLPYPTRSIVEDDPPAVPCAAQPAPHAAAPLPSLADDVAALLHGQPAQNDVGRRPRAVRVGAWVAMHPSWLQTALAPAMQAPAGPRLQVRLLTPPLLNLEAVKPVLLARLRDDECAALLSALACTPPLPISWHAPADEAGHSVVQHRRRRLWGMAVGPRLRTDGATALALVLAQYRDREAFVQVLAAGLPAVMAGLSGAASQHLLGLHDVAQVVHRLVRALPHASACAFRTQSEAGSTLVATYLAQGCDQSADHVRLALGSLCTALAAHVPAEPDALGLTIGLLLAGATKFTGGLSTGDNKKRWRAAALVNMLWSASSFAPFLIAGPIAVTAVGSGLWWDRSHPVRDYATLLGRLEAELTHCLLGAQPPLLAEAQLGRFFLRMRQSFKAAGLPV